MIQAENDLEKQRIALARVIGLAGAAEISPGQPRAVQPVPEICIHWRLRTARWTRRSDYKAALAQLRAAAAAPFSGMEGAICLRSDVSGTYGVLGYTPDGMAPNYIGRRHAQHSDLPGRKGAGRRQGSRRRAEGAPGAGRQLEGRVSNRKCRIPSST